MKSIIFSALLILVFSYKGDSQLSYMKSGGLDQMIVLQELDIFKLHGIKINRHENLITEFYDPLKEAQNSSKLGESRSIDLMMEQIIFIKDPTVKSKTSAEIALWFYDSRKLDQLIYWTERTDLSLLDDKIREELNFKTGYAHLVSKNFSVAERYFNQKNSQYNVPNGYYLAMCNYYLGNLKKAIAGFEKVDSYKPYNEYVPYYLTQIYFADRDFEHTVKYGSKALQNNSLKNKSQMHKLIGLANFELGNYSKANTHLKEYALTAEKLTKEEFYQIAYSQYQSKEYDESISNFKEISNLRDTLGTLANYYIAEMYLRKNDSKAAQTAYAKLGKNAVIANLKEDAQFNYALLSYELGDERLAINTIKNFKNDHLHFDEGQQLLIELFKNTSDFTAAMGVIEELPHKSTELENIYQKLAYKQAVKDYQDDNTMDALSYFSIAANSEANTSLVLESLFWQANIHYMQENKTRAETFLDEIYEVAGTNNDDERQLTFARASYLKAYLLWEKENFSDALPYFENSIKNKQHLNSVQASDAFSRIADIYLLENNYSSANANYLEALRLDNSNDYAAYQLGIVAGLQKEAVDKILILEEFLANYAQSEYRDDALFQIADTYLSMNKLNNSLKIFDQIIEEFNYKSPLTKKVMLRKGLISYNLGNTEAAIKSYKQVFDFSPSAEERKEALTALEEIYINELNDPNAYFNFAENTGGVQLDQFDKDSISYALAHELFKNGDYFNAIRNFERYHKNYKNGFYSVPASYYQAEAHSLLKEYSKAGAKYEGVIDKGDSEYYLKALKKAALINYNHEQNYPKAYEYFDRLISQEKLEELEYISAALICANLSQYQSSVIKYANKLVAHPESNDDQKATAYFYLAKASHKKGSVDEAILAYNKVVMLSKNNKAAEASYALSQIFFDQNKLDQAEVQALETTERSSNYPFWVAKSLLLLADIYISQSDLYNARAAVEATLENYKENEEIQLEAKNKLAAIERLEKESNRVDNSQNSDQIQLDTIKRN